MNIQVVKLVNGEEIIADIVETENTIELIDPMLIGVDNQRLIFIPYMQYTEACKGFVLEKSHVILVSPPVESLIDDYHRATNKPQILTPRKSIISSVN
jgi:hypothetical protein